MCVSLLLLQKSRDVWGIFRVVYISVCHMHIVVEEIKMKSAVVGTRTRRRRRRRRSRQTKCYYYEGPDGLSLRLWDLRDIPFTHPACTVVPGS
jgi:hypothetical protein